MYPFCVPGAGSGMLIVSSGNFRVYQHAGDNDIGENEGICYLPEHGDVGKEDLPDDLVGMSLLCSCIVRDCRGSGLSVQSDDLKEEYPEGTVFDRMGDDVPIYIVPSAVSDLSRDCGGGAACSVLLLSQ